MDRQDRRKIGGGSAAPSYDEIAEAFEQTGSMKGAGRALGIPYSTLKGWRDRDPELLALTTAAMARHEPAKNEVSHAETTSNSYVYSKALDVYTFILVSRQEPYKLSGETWREICYDYPKAGGNATRGQLSLKYDIPRPVLEVLLRTYGLYKHDPPHANEDFERATAEDLEAMQEETLEKKKLNYLVRLDKREIESLRKEVMDLREFRADRIAAEKRLEESAARVMERVGFASKFPALVTPERGGIMGGELFSVHAPIADLHIGKFAWARETWGGDWDTKIAAGVNARHGEEVARFVASLGGACETIWATNVGDHFNGLDLETEAGTPQEQDGRAYKVWEMAFESEVRKIEALRQVCGEVRVRFVPGNHDHIHLQFFYHALSQRYYAVEDVEVVAHPRWQEAFRVAKSLHTLDHGKGLPENLNTASAKAAAERVARNVGGEDYYESRFKFFYTAHLHSESRATEDNMRLYRLPAACDQSDWEAKGRWSAEPGARVWVLDSLGRPDLEKPIYFGEKKAA